MYVDAMDDDVGDIMYGDAWAISNVDTRASTIDCLEGVHDEFFLELDHHISFENDP